MKLHITLIRHGKTSGSDLKLIGVTDEALCAEGERLLARDKQAGRYPDVSLVYSGGSSRCVCTARILYPETPTVILKDLRAPDFGGLEGMTYTDVMRDKRFEEWGRNPHAARFGGEDPHAVQARAVSAFRNICGEMASKGLEEASVIACKLTVEAILLRYDIPRSSYKDREIPCGGGYLFVYDTVRACVSAIQQI